MSKENWYQNENWYAPLERPEPPAAEPEAPAEDPFDSIFKIFNTK